MKKHFYNKELLNKATELHKKGFSNTAIAKELNVDRHHIGKHLKELGYDSNYSKLFEPINRYDYNENIFYEIYSKYENNNISIHMLSREYNFSTNVIRKCLEFHNANIKKPSTKKRIVTFDYDVFNIIDTEEKAYWLGFIFADGNISSNRYSLELSLQEKDYNHLVKFCNFMKCEISNIKKRESTLNSKVYINYRIYLSSKTTCLDLIDKGCVPAKSLILEYPKKIPYELQNHFIRGYFDGDGCISVYKLNSKFACKFSILGTENLLLNSINYICNIDKTLKYKAPKYNKRSNVYILEYGGAKQIEKIYKVLYENSTIYLDRKKDKFIAVLNRDV